MSPLATTRAWREGLRERMRVLLLGRVLAVTVLLAAVLGLRWARGAGAPPVGPLAWAAFALAYAGTLASAVAARRVRRPDALAFLQIALDVALVTVALAMAGAADGALVLLYALPIAAAGGLLLAPGALAAAGLSALAYAGLRLAGGGTPAALAASVAPAWLGIGLVGLLVGSLARRLGWIEEELARRDREMGRLESVHRALANDLECGLLIADGEGRVRSANPAAQRVLGLPADGIVGRRVSWLLPCLAAAEDEGPPVEGHIECEHRAGDGSTRCLRVKRVPIRDTYGNARGDLLLLQDVTRLLELEAAGSGEKEAREEPGLALSCAAAVEEDGVSEPIPGLFGACPAIREVARMVDKVAGTDATVLVTGESGTGKEVVARAVHERSGRRDGRFVVVNCGAIPESLIESELFGHVRGAFTGAVSDRPGLFRRAHGGTIFLDEVGELPLALQVRLLRVLQDHLVTPVGGTTPVGVDVRVVAATNRVLEDAVREGRFREDLYYRLAVITIELPPLRERGRDIELLIARFVAGAAARHGKRIEGASGRAMALLRRYPYPGNVRELENVVEHAVTLCEEPTIREQDLPDSIRAFGRAVPRGGPEAGMAAGGGVAAASAAAPASRTAEEGRDAADPAAPWAGVRLPVDEGDGLSLDDHLARREKEMLLAALARASGVKKRAAGLLGINYRSFRHRLQKYGLDGSGQMGFAMPRIGGVALPRESGR